MEFLAADYFSFCCLREYIVTYLNGISFHSLNRFIWKLLKVNVTRHTDFINSRSKRVTGDRVWKPGVKNMIVEVQCATQVYQPIAEETETYLVQYRNRSHNTLQLREE